MRPKLYSRIARFEAALDSKARSRTKSWTEIAHEFGYYDQMHLVHDFGQFSVKTPTNLMTELERRTKPLLTPSVWAVRTRTTGTRPVCSCRTFE